MAVVDLKTGKIIGCKKGSLSYYHEKGHIAFAKTYKGILYDYCSWAYLKFAVILLIIDTFLNLFIIQIVTLALGLTIVYYYVYEEVWCWKYAYNKKPLEYGDTP